MQRPGWPGGSCTRRGAGGWRPAGGACAGATDCIALKAVYVSLTRATRDSTSQAQHLPHKQAEAPDDIREVALAAAAHERAAQETRNASVLALLHQKASCYHNDIFHVRCGKERHRAAACTVHADAGHPVKDTAERPSYRWQSCELRSHGISHPAHATFAQDGELADLAEAASQAARLRQAVQDASAARDSAQVLTPPRSTCLYKTFDVAQYLVQQVCLCLALASALLSPASVLSSYAPGAGC